MWMDHSTSIAMRVLSSACPRVSLLQTEIWSFGDHHLRFLSVSTFALLRRRLVHVNDPHMTEAPERHYIQPALTFWLLLLKCQQCPSFWFTATLRYVCTCLSQIEDCSCNAIEPSSWKYSVNINLSAGF